MVKEINIPEVVDEVTKAFRRYEEALHLNDLETLDELFWPTEAVVRYGPAETLYGAEAIKRFRHGRPNRLRPRTLFKTSIVTFGHDFAVANAEYQNAGEARLGRQSQSWVRFAGQWRIVSAHVSFLEG